MNLGFSTPLLDYFRRGEVEREVRLLAASGAIAPRATEQLGLLILLVDDPDPEVAETASRTLESIPREPLQAVLAQPDTPPELRRFFESRGIVLGSVSSPDAEGPLIETPIEVAAPAAPATASAGRLVSLLPITERVKLAMRGSREQRAVLIRDPNKLVSLSVLSSPKLTETEVESFARMATLSEEVLRVIGTSRAWLKNYAIKAALARNPRTPPAISMRLIAHLSRQDVKMISMDRNVPEVIRVAARKIMATAESRRH